VVQSDSGQAHVAAALEMLALRLGVTRRDSGSHSEGGDISMPTIYWFVGRSPKNKTCGPKTPGLNALSYAAMLLISVAAPSSVAAPPALDPEEILSRMEHRYERQLQALESYQDRRRYSVTHPLLRKPTYLLVEESFLAPEEKRFEVLERSGSGKVQKSVFSRLLEVERENARESARQAVDLSRRNYSFRFEAFDPAADAYVFDAEPRTANPYLLRGKIWVNAEDYGIQRIEGEPAKKPSFLVRRTIFVHEFAKFGDFWFPVHHRSETDLLLLGRAVLEISYFDYQWQIQSTQPHEEAKLHE
jgi:hypothetical protein